MKKIIFSILLASIGGISIRAQSVTPTAINAAGGSGIIGSNEFDWSIGEMTMVSTFTGSSVIVTQGVLQRHESAVVSIPSSELSKQLKVFPNPVTSFVNIQYTATQTGLLTYQLFDMTGKRIKTKAAEVKQGITTVQVDLSGLASASYMLEVLVNSANEQSEKKSFNIQKIK